MNKFRLSMDGDSLEDSHSEVDMLRDEVKRHLNTIEEKNKIISSLRLQVDDLQEAIEETEKNQELLKQKLDRIQKESAEKAEELEAVSHALREIEEANEKLTKRLAGRTEQLQKFVDDLKTTKKDLDEARNREQQLLHQNEVLSIELETTKSRKRSSRDKDNEEEVNSLKAQISSLQVQNQNLLEDSRKTQEQVRELKQQLENQEKSSARHSLSSSSEQTNEEMVQELYDLRAQVKSLSHRQSRRSIDEEILRLKQELEVAETSYECARHHKDRYERENIQLDRKVNQLVKELDAIKDNYAQLRYKYTELQNMSSPPPPLPPKTTASSESNRVQDENKPEITSAIQFSMVDEPREIMDASSKLSKVVTVNDKRGLSESVLWAQHGDFKHKQSAFDNNANKNRYVTDHRIQKSQFFGNDPAAEQKLRLERANELARRNMQTKPLHQTSYPLELDTFDTTDLTEKDIKSGGYTRQALADFSNQRSRSKRAEAFIV